MLSGQRENLAAQPAHIGNMATPNDVISGMQLREASQAEPARDCKILSRYLPNIREHIA